MLAHSYRSAQVVLARGAGQVVLGEHNDLIYRDRLGYGTDELQELHASGVV